MMAIRGGIDDHHSLNSLYIMMAIRGGIDDHHSLNSLYIMMAIRWSSIPPLIAIIM
jgi:hypothetical protein